jgi:pyrroline-5-carboxylate reductase
MTTSLSRFGQHIVLFGCGNMASAMLGRWLDAGLDPAQVTAIRPSGEPVGDGVKVVTTAAAAPVHPAILMIGVKPQMLGEVAEDIASLIGPDTIVLSILAGVTIDDLRARFPAAAARMRVMPNMPVRTGKGVVGLAGAEGKPAPRKTITRLMAPLGHVEWIEDESLFDALTALTGSGPAFIYRFVDAMRAGAERLGFDEPTALRLARATLAGAAAQLAVSDLTPTELAAQVASRGGMTQAGLDVLDEDARLASLMTETLRAARARGRELAALAREGQD